VADREEGQKLDALLAALVAEGYRFAQPELKRTPAPFPADHPRAQLLRRKGLAAWREVADTDFVSSPALAPATMAAFRRLAPLLAWLDANLGS
jgi:uncharacterized protein (DUF2461 family)